MTRIVSHALIALAAFSLICSAALAGTGNNKRSKPAQSPDCLEVCAKAVLDGQEQTGLTVKLYCGSEEIVKIDSTEFSKVYFTLKRDRYYTVELSKPGCVSRLVGISTYVPKYIPLKPLFRFEFEVEMLKETKLADDYYLDFPVALVSFDEKNECFAHHKKYTSRIKREISRMKENSMVVTE